MWIQRLKTRIEALTDQQSKSSAAVVPESKTATSILDRKAKELQIKQEIYMKRKVKKAPQGSSAVKATEAVASDWVFVNMEDRKILVTDFVRLRLQIQDDSKVAIAVDKILACKNLASRVVMGGDDQRIIHIKGVTVEGEGQKLVIKSSLD
jgi:hypothetical protein